MHRFRTPKLHQLVFKAGFVNCFSGFSQSSAQVLLDARRQRKALGGYAFFAMNQQAWMGECRLDSPQ
jgi:hypothetical protein